MVRNEQQHPQLIFQLAINTQGVLRGNYTGEIADHTAPIHGAVDKATQWAAWTVGGNTSTVMKAGLSNLTEGEVPAFLNKYGKTQRWLPVRLEQPEHSSNRPLVGLLDGHSWVMFPPKVARASPDRRYASAIICQRLE